MHSKTITNRPAPAPTPGPSGFPVSDASKPVHPVPTAGAPVTPPSVNEEVPLAPVNPRGSNI